MFGLVLYENQKYKAKKKTHPKKQKQNHQKVAYFISKSLTLMLATLLVTRKCDFFPVEEFLQPFRWEQT